MTTFSGLVEKLGVLVDLMAVKTQLEIKAIQRQLKRDDAVGATFDVVKGDVSMENITSLTLQVGQTGFVKVNPKKADGSPDPTVENVVATINGGASGDAFAGLAPYGDGSDPLKFAITGLATDENDVPHVGSKLLVDFDSNTEDGVQSVHVELPLVINPTNADSATFDSIEAPPAT